MTLRLRAKVLLHVWSYDIYDMIYLCYPVNNSDVIIMIKSYHVQKSHVVGNMDTIFAGSMLQSADEFDLPTFLFFNTFYRTLSEILPTFIICFLLFWSFFFHTRYPWDISSPFIC